MPGAVLSDVTAPGGSSPSFMDTAASQDTHECSFCRAFWPLSLDPLSALRSQLLRQDAYRPTPTRRPPDTGTLPGVCLGLRACRVGATCPERAVFPPFPKFSGSQGKFLQVGQAQ